MEMEEARQEEEPDQEEDRGLEDPAVVRAEIVFVPAAESRQPTPPAFPAPRSRVRNAEPG
jgi:hypothetical protein